MVGVAQQSYSYLRPSALVDDGRGRALHLETSGGSTPAGLAEHPRFFAGFLAEPEQGAKGLLSVAAVARARYYVPMTSQRLQEILDPVVTSNGDRLRFESFSGCCGVYARLDVLSGGLDGDLMDRGTTNVDVNLPLRDALARVGGGEPLHLAVGADDVTVTTLDDAVVETQGPAAPAVAARVRRGAGQCLGHGPARRDRRRRGAPVPALAAEGQQPRGAVGGAGRPQPAGHDPPGAGCGLPGRAGTAGEPRCRCCASRRHLRVYGPVVGPGAPPVPSAWELVLRDARLSPHAVAGPVPRVLRRGRGPRRAGRRLDLRRRRPGVGGAGLGAAGRGGPDRRAVRPRRRPGARARSPSSAPPDRSATTSPRRPTSTASCPTTPRPSRA